MPTLDNSVSAGGSPATEPCQGKKSAVTEKGLYVTYNPARARFTTTVLPRRPLPTD